LHNPQGRVVAMLALVRSAAEENFAVLPRELTGAVTARLRKYVLRARVTNRRTYRRVQRVVGVRHEAASSAWPAISWASAAFCSCLAKPAIPHRPIASRLRDGRTRTWRPDCAGIAATSEQFVAQMLNLDLLGAIAFDKGVTPARK
jgi:folate-binding Fe-S cluster repair protein YgfZ